MQEQVKVKVQYHNDPKRFRFVTREAAGYLAPKWVLAPDQEQPAPQEKKAQAAAPAEDRRVELREKYKSIVGEAVNPEYESWNQARLHIEIVKAETQAKQKAEREAHKQAEQETEQAQVQEAVVTDKPKRKGKKAVSQE